MDKIGDYDWGVYTDSSIPSHETCYRFQCDCLSPEDAMDVDVEQDIDGKHITLTLSFDGRGLASRLRYAWQILTGQWTWREFIVRADDFPHLRDIFDPQKSLGDLP